jgi:hypothetical protein
VPTYGQVPYGRLTHQRLLIRGPAFSIDYGLYRLAFMLPLHRTMRYYIHSGPAALRFELAGDLNAGDAWRLEQDWRRVSSAMGNGSMVVDVSFVTGIDEAARSLFKRWYARGSGIRSQLKAIP